MNIAILLAGGSGSRFGSDKIAEDLCGKPVFLWSVDTFINHPNIDGIILVGSKNNIQILEKHTNASGKVVAVIQGGESRFESSIYGFEEAKKAGAKTVTFHNLANPGVSTKEISDVIESAKKTGAAGVARKTTSTLRNSTGGIIPREDIFEMETPQTIQCDIFEKGIFHLSEIPTDDLQIAEAAGIAPEIVLATWQNRKITTKEDFSFLELFFEKTMQKSHPQHFFHHSRKVPLETRVGIGQDSHRFSESESLILGGIKIQDAPKLKGNSDGDAVLHALTNAISSAMGGGSLSNFSDKMCQNGITDSSEYLRKILYDLKEKKGGIINISIAIEAGRPKLEKHFPKMKAALGDICEIEEEKVGITVTSGEKLTECGRGNGIGVFAIVLLSVPNG